MAITQTKKTKDYRLDYVIYTYGLFVLLLLIFGGLATKALSGVPSIMRWVTALTAWTPTYVFLLMFKKLYPNDTLQNFFRRSFAQRANIRLLATTTIVQILVFISGVYLISIQKNVAITSLLDFSFPTITQALFFTLIQGATGEETGWRGYLLPAFEKNVGVVKSLFLVSIIWSLWHAPLWFLTTEYNGISLIQYITAFVICITSLGISMGICYRLCRNLLVPIWIHFIFNFLGEAFTGSLVDLVTWYAVFYFAVAVGLLIATQKGFKIQTT